MSQQRTARAAPAGDFERFEPREVEQSVARRFESRAARYPGRVAVKTRSHRLTYADLNAEANRVARAVLERAGGGAAGPVALLLEKGAPAVAAMLGVLKAGLPQAALDPSFPRARLAALLEDLGSGLVVTDARGLALATELAGAGRGVLNVDEIGAGAPADNLSLDIAPGALAFVIYTSGSTGEPKGVCLEQRTLLHRVLRQTNSFRIRAEDRLSHLASFGTGQGLLNIFCALLNGAGLYPLDVRAEGLAGLAAWLADEEITIYRSSASVFRYFTDTLSGRERFPALRLARLSSEQVTRRDIELCKKHFPAGCVFVNGLSTSETGIVREFFMDAGTLIEGNSVPVGYPVEGMSVRLLGEAGGEVPPGEVGEIAVTSRHLSPGYWRRPELTRSAFREDPAGGGRVYLTGDMGRMLPGGLLLHVGRKDFQLKVRGHRVEVGEAEAALLGCAGVKEAVVAARADARGETRLVAYLVAERGASLNTDALRRSLRETLPEYMLPSAFEVLDALPLTPSGKVNRLALPASSPTTRRAATDYVAPRTEAERVLAEIWAEVLGLERVGVGEDFFDAGGHSLLATRVVSRINTTFRIELPLRAVFESPTVAALALSVEGLILDELEALSEEEARRLLDASPAGGGVGA
ncbi:MAG TPA: non-ribosomal peptide synthetase [Pyrinomonadaceae bacterium]|nr:non-ribosomal peptide synthetase [Pyrinomonadaceae bacterium]